MGGRAPARADGGGSERCQVGDMEFPARGAQERREVVETLGIFEPTQLPLVGQRPVGALVAEDMLYAWRRETGDVGRSVLRPACGVLRRGRGEAGCWLLVAGFCPWDGRLETVDLRLEAGHPEVLRGGKRQCEKFLRLLLVARVATRQQHAGVVVLGVRLPRPCPRLGVQRQRGVEMLRGLIPPGEQCRQETQVVGDRAIARLETPAAHHVPPGVRVQEGIEGGRPAHIAEEDADLREHHDATQPTRIPSQPNEVVGRQDLKLAPGLRLLPQDTGQKGRGDLPAERRGILGGKIRTARLERLEFLDASLLLIDDPELRKQDGLDRGVILHALAEAGRPVGEVLSLAEAPF